MRNVPATPRGRTRHILPGLFLLTLTAATTNARQEVSPNSFHERWRWSHFSVEDGLPSDRVTDVVESNGFAFAATDSGLARYDGWTWRTLGPEEGLPREAVIHLSLDREQNLWVATSSGLFRGSGDRFQGVPLPQESPNSIVLSVVHTSAGTHIAELRNAFDGSQKLYRLSDVWESIHPSDELFEGAGPVLVQDADEEIWLCTQNGLFLRAGRDSWVDRLPDDIPPGVHLRCTSRARDSGVLLGIDRPVSMRGLWKIGSEGLRRIDEEGPGIPLAVTAGPAGTIVCLYDTHELRFSVGGLWHTIAPLPPEFLSTTFLRFRPNGDLWVGSENGLHLFRLFRQHWDLHRHPGFNDPRNRINAILSASDGSIWLGNASGVEVLDEKGETSLPTPLPEEANITGLAQDSAGIVWVSSGSSFPGLYGWEGTKWIRLEHDSDGNPLPLIHRIRRDSRGTIWLLGLAADVQHAQDETGDVHILTEGRAVHWKQAGELGGARTYDVNRTQDGGLWFGTSRGISRLLDGTWRHWDTESGLRQDLTFRLRSHGNYGVWFAQPTQGVGILIPDMEIRYLPLEREEYRRIWDIAPDGQRLWVTTNNGLRLFRRDLYETSSTTFEKLTGLQNPKAWPILVLPDRILVGTIGGGLYSLSRSLEESPAPRATASILLDEQEQPEARWRVAGYWGDPPTARVETRFRLDGGPWNPYSTSRNASLSGLASGQHTLEVQARGALGDGGLVAERSFFVPIPFYRRVQFMVPLGILTAGLLTLATVYVLRRRRDAQAIRGSAREFRKLMEQGSDAVLICDEKGRIRNTNLHAQQLFGDEPALPGRRLRELLAGKNPAEKLALAAALASPPEKPIRLNLRGPNGVTLPVEVRVSRLSHAGLQLVIRDLTTEASKEMESRALEDWAAEVQAFEDLGRATQAIFQELGNGHLTILGHADEARRKLEQTPPQRDAALAHLKKALEAAERAGNLSREVLAYSSQSAGDALPVDLNQILRGLRGPLSFLTRPSAMLHLELAEGLPLVEADAARAGHLIVRLVEVFCVSSQETPCTLTLRTFRTDRVSLPTIPRSLDHLGREERLAALEIRCSAPLQDTPAFEDLLGEHPEITAPNIDPRTGAIRGLVRANRVAVHGSSDSEGRVCLRVFFPAPTNLLARPPLPGPSPSDRKSVLVIDDDLGVRHVVSRMLQRSGYTTLGASGGKEGIALFARHRENLFCTVIDVSMPDVDGATTRQQILALAPDAKVFLMSGLHEDAVRGEDVKGYDGVFLHKPFTPEDLLEAVRSERQRETAES